MRFHSIYKASRGARALRHAPRHNRRCSKIYVGDRTPEQNTSQRKRRKKCRKRRARLKSCDERYVAGWRWLRSQATSALSSPSHTTTHTANLRQAQEASLQVQHMPVNWLCVCGGVWWWWQWAGVSSPSQRGRQKTSCTSKTSTITKTNIIR